MFRKWHRSQNCLPASTLMQHKKPFSLFFIVLALSSRMDGGLWSHDHKLPKLVTTSLNCFVPKYPGTPGVLARPEGGSLESLTSPCVVHHRGILPGSGIPPLRSLDLAESDLLPCPVFRREVLSCASKMVPSFQSTFHVFFFFFPLFRRFLKALLSQCTG